MINLFHKKSECINVPLNQLPKISESSRPLMPPIKPPENISHNNWKNWWVNNKYIYGSRKYYEYLGYPLWWLDYYYPENNIDLEASLYTDFLKNLFRNKYLDQTESEIQIFSESPNTTVQRKYFFVLSLSISCFLIFIFIIYLLFLIFKKFII
jgi:hypothetical protein